MAKNLPGDQTAPADEDTPVGKGRPTPTRKEREAALRQPLVPKDRRLAAKQNRAKLNAERERARVGMANGEEKYLTARDKGPQRRYARDFVDARFSVGEILMPVLVLVILTWFFPIVAEYALYSVWVVVLIVIADSIVLGFQLKRRLIEKFGADRLERGVRVYAAMRAAQMRFMRVPKPQVKRGEYPS